MTRADLRGLLRRRLQERVAVTGGVWSDADLNTMLRLGLQEMQKKVLVVDPEAFIYIDRADVVANQELYELPAGLVTIYDLRMKGTDNIYASLGSALPRHEAIGRTDSTIAWFRYSSKYFGLSPAQTTALASGLEIEWGPTLTMAADTDEPALHTMLHMGIVLYAEKFALGDTGESGGKLDPEIAPYVNSIPQYYSPIARPGRITVNAASVGRDY